MKYYPPFGSADPDASYIDKNVPGAVRGSAVPARAIEYPQREIVDVITEAGLTPEDDLQLWDALKMLGLSGGSRARRWMAIISMTIANPPASPSEGDAYLVPTGAGGIWASKAGKIAEWTGSVWSFLQPTDGHGVCLPDGVLWIRSSGVYSPMVITTAITKSVYGVGADFADINAANAWLSKRRIASTGSVTLSIGSGKFANGTVAQRLEHPDGPRITLTGASLVNGGVPAPSDFVATGNALATRGANAATNLTLVRNRIPTELTFTGLAGLTLVNIGVITNLLVTGDGTPGTDGIYVYGGASRLTNIVAAVFGNRGFVTRFCILALSGVIGFGCGANGVSIEVGTSASMLGPVAGFGNGLAGVNVSGANLENNGYALCGSGNGGEGVSSTRGSFVQTSLSGTSFARYNTVGFYTSMNAFMSVTGAESSNNSGNGFLSQNNSAMTANSTTGSNNGNGYGASSNSYMNASSGTAGTLSPAANSVGNGNSYISA